MTQTMEQLWPVEGTWVRVPEGQRVGMVLQCQVGKNSILVDWGGEQETLGLDDLESGIQVGWTVQEIPSSIARQTLGVGQVTAVRRLAGCDQSLVQLHADGRLVWLPSFSLKRIMGPELAFIRAEPRYKADAGERWGLCMIAHALRSWNEATGALDRLDVDPLPHQIQLVHRIVNSGQTNWIIADDVGLGKTIEVGLLMAALERRSRLARVLVVCPAGLTRQWQQEMHLKFDRDFEIYAQDFQVDEIWKWKLHDRVVASLDLIKPRRREDEGADLSTHFGRILAAASWDLIIFDEGHRLSRTDDGDQTLRFLLGRALRERTEAMLLLTGTPHQGDTGKFRSLLKLVRPDLSDDLDELELHPEIVAEVVLRNRKVDVTDADGNFIFQGHTVRRFPIDPTPDMRELDRKLQIYLRHGYNAGAELGGYVGRAIGFVMTTYRKLASSSVAALTRALERRLECLRAGEQAEQVQRLADELDFDDTLDDIADRDLGEPRSEFFVAEIDMLQELLQLCNRAGEKDSKIETFRAVYDDLVIKQKKKVLIFTEYRATQERLATEVGRLSGQPPAIINGSQKLDDKIAAMEAFDSGCDVLISTEAGGEGLNLHRHCHIVLNFDLPWNPARIVQRIGRVYRYGQKEHVAVINFHARGTIDADIVSLAFSRVETLARQMAPIGTEFDERYFSEIFGELLEQLDLSSALADALSGSVERSKQRVEDAIERARKARDLQTEILTAATGFDPEALIRLGRFRTRDVMSFIERLAPFLGIEAEVRDELRERIDLRLPETFRGRFSEFGARTVIEATTSRATASVSRSIHLLDFGSAFLRELINIAIAPEFGGSYAAARMSIEGHVGAFVTRWQSDQGEPIGDELTIARRDTDGEIVLDNSIVVELLEDVVETVEPVWTEPAERREILESIRDRVEVAAAGKLNRFKHLNDLVTVAAADVHP